MLAHGDDHISPLALLVQLFAFHVGLRRKIDLNILAQPFPRLRRAGNLNDQLFHIHFLDRRFPRSDPLIGVIDHAGRLEHFRMLGRERNVRILAAHDILEILAFRVRRGILAERESLLFPFLADQVERNGRRRIQARRLCRCAVEVFPVVAENLNREIVGEITGIAHARRFLVEGQVFLFVVARKHFLERLERILPVVRHEEAIVRRVVVGRDLAQPRNRVERRPIGDDQGQVIVGGLWRIHRSADFLADQLLNDFVGFLVVERPANPGLLRLDQIGMRGEHGVLLLHVVDQALVPDAVDRHLVFFFPVAFHAERRFDLDRDFRTGLDRQ